MNSRQKIVQQQFLNNEAAIIQRLERVYGQALKDIGSKIQGDYAAIQQITDMIDQLDPDDPQRVILESMRQSKVYQKTYQDALQKQVSNVLGAMQLAQYDNVSDYLRECYDGGFLGTMYDLHGQGIPIITPINQQKLIHAVQLDSKISQGLYTRLGQDVIKLKQWISSEVSRCAVTGASWARCAEILNNRAQIGYHNAVRIARTEGHRIQCAAAMDALDDAKEAGADVVKQWDATLDGGTRESHRAVDGQIRELDQTFSNGLRYPGDPAGGAAEVINCRCALLQRARWAMDQEELDTLKDRAAQHELWSDDPDELRRIKEQSFDDFKKKYIVASETTTAANSGGIMGVTWGTSTAGKRFKSKKDAFNHFVDNGIKVGDSRKYPMGEDVAIGMAEWHSKFCETFPEFISSIRHRLPEIKNVAPSALQPGVLGQFSYYLTGECVGIKLNSTIHASLAVAGQRAMKTFTSGWHSGGSPLHTIIHEYGHYVSHSMGELERGFEHRLITETVAEYKRRYPQYKSDTYKGATGGILSRYGTTSEAECFAECFAEYYGEENPREFATIFGELLDAELKGVK